MTDLKAVGCTKLKPQTFFFWNSEDAVTVEITDLEDQYYLIRASKTYRLLKQGEEGRSWMQNITNLNDYLKNHFSKFQASIDYVNSVDTEVTESFQEAEQDARRSQQLVQQKEELQNRIEKQYKSKNLGFEELEEHLQVKLENLENKLHQVETEIKNLQDNLERRKKELNEWQRGGVMMAYTFTVSTDPQISSQYRLQDIVDQHLAEIRRIDQEEIFQRLRQSKFRLEFESVQHPSVFNRLEHSMLLNPESLEELIQQNPELEDILTELKKKNLAQFDAYASRDLLREGATFEDRKAAPAQALKAVLEDLDEVRLGDLAVDPPNDGPMIGTVAGTKRVVGFDPADVENHGMAHYYITGETGAGKTALKKVLIENAASLGYDVLDINPRDTETIGLSLPNPDNDQGTGLNADQYWIGDDRLLDRPSDIHELFDGINGVTLKNLSNREKQEFVTDILTEAKRLDQLTNPLFIFIEEAQNFNTGQAADALQTLVREGRKFMVHIGIVTQSPMEFTRNHKHVRENTTTIFLPGEYFDYADDFLDDKREIQDLETQQAIIQSRDFPKTRVDIRDTLTLPTRPSESEITEIDQYFSQNLPDLGKSGKPVTESKPEDRRDSSRDEIEFSSKERELLDFIESYIRENDEAPSESKCWREGPVGSGTVSQILDQLADKGVLETREVERHGNEFEVYHPT